MSLVELLARRGHTRVPTGVPSILSMNHVGIRPCTTRHRRATVSYLMRLSLQVKLMLNAPLTIRSIDLIFPYQRDTHLPSDQFMVGHNGMHGIKQRINNRNRTINFLSYQTTYSSNRAATNSRILGRIFRRTTSPYRWHTS